MKFQERQMKRNQVMVFLIFLSAKRRVGKDTLANYLRDKHRFVKVAYADVLKDEVTEATGIPRHEFDDDALKEQVAPGHTLTRRQLLQEHGVAKRAIDPLYWVRQCHRKINTILRQNKSVVVSDTRFPNELQYMFADEDHGNPLKIVRARIVRPQRAALYGDPTVDTHISETALDNYLNFDLDLVNPENDRQSLFDQMDKCLE